MIIVSGLEPKQYNVTAEGFTELQGHLKLLKQRRKELAGELSEISSQSTDLGAREDSAFALHQNQATEFDGQIELLERILGMAVVIEGPNDFDVIRLGAKACIELDGKEHCYKLVGPLEADPAENKISDESPLGRTLLGKRVKDRFDVVSPAGQHMNARVLRIHA